MRLEIVVAPQPSARAAANAHAHPFPPGASPALQAAVTEREALDVFLDGVRITAPVGESHGAYVLRDLALALVELGLRARAKTAIRFYDEPWELCIERFGATACISVYRTGTTPLVSVYDRPVPFDDIVSATRCAIDRFLGRADHRKGVGLELATAVERLRTLPRASATDAGSLPEAIPIVVESRSEAPLAFRAEFSLRETSPPCRDLGIRSRPADPGRDGVVERADMHALLFRGRVTALIRQRRVDLGESHPILVAERLIELSRRAFDAWERGVPFNARSEAAGVLVGMRVSTQGELALTLGAAHRGPRRTVHTFPALAIADALEAALSFGRSLVRAILRSDRAQFANLRLGALRRALRESADQLRQAHRTDSKVNPTPEPYRAFAAALEPRASAEVARTPMSFAGARLRYAARWRAIVPGIDLRATYLCGERLIVGATTEMWALDRTTGQVIWRVDVPRGTSVVTPGGVARLAPDGALRVYDFDSGETRLRGRIAPRSGAPVAGAVVHLPGLPKLLVVTESEHHLVAVDLTTGEPRWRWSWGPARSRGAPRMKRSGKLVYFISGDAALTALDVQSGEVVWRLRDRMRFRVPPTIASDALFVVSGGARGMARLYCIDPYAGNVRWSRPLGEPTAPCTVEGPALVAESAVAVAVRQKSGLTLASFRRDDGTTIGTGDRTVAASGTSWIAVDDTFIGNMPTGELVALDATRGDLRWRHVLGPRPLEADVPRRLEPVLRCGALFVPCSLVNVGPVVPSRSAEAFGGAAAAGVSVLRPSDGAPLGVIAPTETIPDLLRVDERCNVYVAEESGHLVAFGALPRLSLVRES